MEFYQTNSTTYAWKYHLTEWFYEVTYSSNVGSTGQNFLHRPNLPWIQWPEISNQGNSFLFSLRRARRQSRKFEFKAIKEFYFPIQSLNVLYPFLQSYRLIECNTVSHLISFITLNRNFCSVFYVSLITIFHVFNSYLFIFSS